MGGAVNALGRLLMKNTALRGHRAINGGALYTEGKVSIERSVMTFNTADRCGGMIYSAGKTTIDSCKLESNRCGHFDCKKKSAAQIMGPLGEFDDDMLGGGGDDSALGAVAEGPPLTIDGRAAHARAVAEGATTARMPPRPPRSPRRRRRKRSSSAAVAELDDLAEEIEYDEELASRMEQEEEEQEEQERAAEERQRAAEAEAVPPLEEEPTCDPERHGGKGGNLHELACEAGLWPTGRKVPITPYHPYHPPTTPLPPPYHPPTTPLHCTLGAKVRPLTPPHTPSHTPTPRYARYPPSASCGAPPPTAPLRGSASRARCALRTRARTHARSRARARASHYSPPLVAQPPSPRRRRPAWQDLGCFDFVPHDSSGACECAGGHMTAATDCEHEGFTCQKECRLLRQRRRRQKAAGQRAAGLTPTKALEAGYGKLFAIGAFGAKDTRGSLLDGFGLLCSDGSRTAIAGEPRPGPIA